jgi:hypothetical protein
MEINRDNIEKRLRDEFEPTYLVSPVPFPAEASTARRCLERRGLFKRLRLEIRHNDRLEEIRRQTIAGTATVTPTRTHSITTRVSSRLVNDLLKDEMVKIHAFSQKTYTPEEWNKKQQAASHANVEAKAPSTCAGLCGNSNK